MGLFDSKPKKELERLEKAAAEDPTSYNLTMLVKKYWELNDTNNAMLVAKQALDRFPDVDEVFEIYSRLRKNQSQKEIETLKKIIEERPTPNVFAQIAEIYTDLRDEDTAMRYCKQAMEMFPNDDNAYLIIGELRLRRFYMDLLAKDGRLAMENLEKAFEINNKNYKALLILAKFYLQIGLINKSRQRLKNILVFAPEDDNARELLELSFKIPKPPHEDLDLLLQSIEDQRKLHYVLTQDVTTVTIKPTPEMFQEPLAAFKEFPGINMVLACEEASGNLVAHYKKDDTQNIESAHEIATNMFRAVQNSSHQMDLGRFHKSELEGAFGSLHLLTSEHMVYAIFSSPTTKRDQIRKSIQEFLIKMANIRLSIIHHQNEHHES